MFETILNPIPRKIFYIWAWHTWNEKRTWPTNYSMQV